MATPLLDRLRSAAASNAGLVALLEAGSPALFRWFDIRLNQGSALPAVTVQQISNPSDYAITGRLVTSWTRVQFTIWAPDGPTVEQVSAALYSFLDGFSGDGITGPANPTLIIGSRDGMFPQKDPPLYTRVVEARIFSNDTL